MLYSIIGFTLILQRLCVEFYIERLEPNCLRNLRRHRPAARHDNGEDVVEDVSPWVLPPQYGWRPAQLTGNNIYSVGKCLLCSDLSTETPSFIGLVETFPGNMALFSKESLVCDEDGTHLTISAIPAGNRPYRSGAFASKHSFKYGRFEAEIKAARGSGLVTHKEVPAAFDRELQRVTTEVVNATESLRSIQLRKRTLTSRSKVAREQQFSTRRAERFIGNIESALELHRKLGCDSELVEEVRRLKGIVQTLEKELREKDIELRKNQALRVINVKAGDILQGLDVEDPNAPISLEINDLTIKVLGDERDDYLSEIGSGSNWLSYHLAVLLSLHQFYLSQKITLYLVFLFLTNQVRSISLNPPSFKSLLMKMSQNSVMKMLKLLGGHLKQ